MKNQNNVLTVLGAEHVLFEAFEKGQTLMLYLYFECIQLMTKGDGKGHKAGKTNNVNVFFM